MDGDLVARGDRDGENEGDIADEVLKLPLASWPMGDRGKWAGARLKWGGSRIGRLMALGATLVSRGGGMWVGGAEGGGFSTTLPAPAEEWDEECLLLADDEAPLPLCSDMVSSFSLAISENTCASGWYCGPQSRR